MEEPRWQRPTNRSSASWRDLRMRKLLLPVLLGLLAAGWLLYRRDLQKVRFEEAADERGRLHLGGPQRNNLPDLGDPGGSSWPTEDGSGSTGA